MSKPTFRSPLRNEWERHQAAFAAMALKDGREGVIARALLEFMPVLVAMVERERDKGTAPLDFQDAIAAVAGAMIEEAIEKQRATASPAAVLDRMMRLIHRVVSPRVTARKSGLILPEGMG